MGDVTEDTVMNASENTLIDLRQQIQSTLDLVRKKQVEVRMPGVASPVQSAPADVSVPDTDVSKPLPRIDNLVERDQQIARELLHLQRTLSRQTFRGAESARRLVRRLVRKAELNAQDLVALKGGLPTSGGMRGEESAHIQLLLAEISHNLADLEQLGQALAGVPGAGQASREERPADRP